jgi:hypothetical protein
VDAAHNIQEMYNLLQSSDLSQRVQDFLSNENCQWHFIPTHIPLFGGLWEAAVKSITYYIRRTLGNSILTCKELTTLLAQIEAFMNSRPLLALSNDSHVPLLLSPAHFLIGEALTSLPDNDLSDMTNRLRKWQLMKQFLQRIWQRWSRDYLHTLQQSQRRTSRVRNLKLNDVFILQEDNVPPLQERLGVVESIHPGSDGCVRVVKVRTARGTSSSVQYTSCVHYPNILIISWEKDINPFRWAICSGFACPL